MERKLERKVLQIMKLNADNLIQQSGIEPSLSMEEAKEYLHEVLEEVKEIKK